MRGKQAKRLRRWAEENSSGLWAVYKPLKPAHKKEKDPTDPNNPKTAVWRGQRELVSFCQKYQYKRTKRSFKLATAEQRSWR